eukprot:TRINITY_DN4308_c0_g1_i1.p1 TRINITY_DN4308_c0_g1~~TRINITY_DN4308_c0_g1_i1.p1  ORF type:complete len:412 (-),score=27.34 TRINITY_DN4308_c0_g1_i1:118-1353(-)
MVLWQQTAVLALTFVPCHQLYRLSREGKHLFAEYKKSFGREYADDSEEHAMRQAIFLERLAEVEEHNAGSFTWKKGLNHMSDRTQEELAMLHGYRRGPKRKIASSFLDVAGNESSCSGQGQSCMEGTTCCGSFVCAREGVCLTAASKETVDWTPLLQTSNEILHQGSCGSCWAVATAGVLTMHAEITSKGTFTKVISPHNILECTPNPNQCGGQGGCTGATVELALQYFASSKRTAGTLDTFPYQPMTSGCPYTASSFLESTQPGVRVGSFVLVPQNKAKDMREALATVGPLGVSLDATGLKPYASGVITDCESWVINHAVIMMGYGYDAQYGVSYWKLRNSWGKGFGEDGFFRLGRSTNEEGEPCGTDTKPEDGYACRDKDGKYPESQNVCGECGILSDTAYPLAVEPIS